MLVVLSPECCGGERPRTEDVGTVPPGPLGKSVPSSTFPCAEPHRCHLEGAQGPGEEAPPGWFCSELCRSFPLIFFFFFFIFSFSLLYELSCLRLRANAKASCYRGNWCGMAAWAGGTGWRAAGRCGGSRGSPPRFALCLCESGQGEQPSRRGSSPGSQGGLQAGSSVVPPFLPAVLRGRESPAAPGKGWVQAQSILSLTLQEPRADSSNKGLLFC